MNQRLLIKLSGVVASLLFFSQGAYAQTQIRSGVVQLVQLREFSEQGSTTLSRGLLADLEADPNFGGDFQFIVDTAANILSGYTIVERGGYFPENAGIPREQQLTRAEAVYYVFSLASGNELVLYRTPIENTAEYYIRTPSNTF